MMQVIVIPVQEVKATLHPGFKPLHLREIGGILDLMVAGQVLHQMRAQSRQTGAPLIGVEPPLGHRHRIVTQQGHQFAKGQMTVKPKGGQPMEARIFRPQLPRKGVQQGHQIGGQGGSIEIGCHGEGLFLFTFGQGGRIGWQCREGA